MKHSANRDAGTVTPMVHGPLGATAGVAQLVEVERIRLAEKSTPVEACHATVLGEGVVAPTPTAD